MDYDIQSDVEINQYQLENECISMASTYYKYADMAREAKSLVSEKSDMVKVITAERSIAIREENKDKKLTVDLVQAMVNSDSEVVKAMRELRDAEATYLRLSAAVSSLEIKKSELDNLVKLRCNAMYVDSPSKPTRDIKNEEMSNFNRRSMTPLPNSVHN